LKIAEQMAGGDFKLPYKPDEPEANMSLYISMNSASRELDESPIYRAIVLLAAKVMQQRGNLPATPQLDITFMIPGQFERPEFEGMRMGNYDHVTGILHFEVAVPRHIIHSTQAAYYTSMVLLDAIDNAAYYFRDTFNAHGVHFEAEQWHRALISLIDTANSNTANSRESTLHRRVYA